MKKEVAIELGDLRALIETMFEKDVRKLAETMVITQPENFDRETALNFDRQISEIEPEARKKVELRYRHLLEALGSGKDVARALKSFVRRG
jgi:hypothetical protein